MKTCGQFLVKTSKKLLFIQKCPQFSQKSSASHACMLATFSLSGKCTNLSANSGKTVILGPLIKEKELNIYQINPGKFECSHYMKFFYMFLYVIS